MVCTNGNLWASVCYFRCHPHYKLQGQSVVSCEGDTHRVTWTAPIPSCLSVSAKCAPLTTPGHGHMKCTNGSSLRSECRFACRSGYKIDGSTAVICSGSHEHAYWNASLPTCISFAWKCPNLTAPRNGMMKCSNGNAKDSVCYFSCMPGYQLEGTTSTICKSDGHGANWTAPTPQCSAVKPEALRGRQCRKLRKPKHGLVHCETARSSKFYPAGTVCSYYCRAGYEIPYQQVGNGVIICIGPHWNITARQLACLPVQCTVPVIPAHGKLTCNSKGSPQLNETVGSRSVYPMDTVCQYECKPGYTLSASHPDRLTTKCNAPNWNVSSLPECKVTGCSSPPSILNGHLKCDSEVTQMTVPGTTCYYTCFAGFVIPTSQAELAKRQCLPSLQWNVTNVPDCKNASVPQPSASACTNDEYKTNDPSSVVLRLPEFVTADGNPAEVTCSLERIENYGSHEILCQAMDPELRTLASCRYTITMKSTGNEATIDHRCSPLEAPVNGRITCQAQNSKLHCKVQCKSGFGFAPLHSALSKGYVECDQEQGHWDFQQHNTDYLPDCLGELSTTVLQAPLIFQVGIQNCSGHESLDKLVAAVRDVLISFNSEMCSSVQCADLAFECGVGNESTRFALKITWTLQASYSPDADYDNVSDAEALIEKIQVQTQKAVTSDPAFLEHIAEVGGEVWQDSYQQGLFMLVCQKPGYAVDPDTNKCFQCPTGTYEDDGSCHVCPGNHYQDETGQTNCKSCPGDTVAEMGSRSKEACLNTNNRPHIDLPPPVRDQARVHTVPWTQCNPNPCSHGGICIITRDSFHCACTNGYTGKQCEEAPTTKLFS